MLSTVVGATEACHAIAPEIDAAATIIQDPTVMVNCTRDFELCSDLDVSAYPAVRLYHGLDEVVRYRGARGAARYVNLLRPCQPTLLYTY